MVEIITINSVIFLLGQVIFLAITKAEFNILETTIVTENNEAISLKWVESASFLANEHLPIWTTGFNLFLHQNLDIMKQIGKFRTYHDPEKSSAVVLFEQWNCIYGVIDVRYDIVCLPLDQLHQYHEIGRSQHVRILQNIQEFPDHPKPLDLSKTSSTNSDTRCSDTSSNNFQMLIRTIINSNEPSTSSYRHHNDHNIMDMPTTSHDDSTPNKRQCMMWQYEDQVITVYPEILIFIPYEISRSTRELSTLVVQYLVQFNAVAMLFAKLATHNINIHINIAGIVIEMNRADFKFSHLLEIGNSDGQLLLTFIMNYIKVARKKGINRKQFPDDSFDMFLFSTTDDWYEKATHPGGISTEVFDVLTMRNHRLCVRDKIYLGALVDRSRTLQHYVNAAREIAHLMTVQDDPLNRDLCYNGMQCHGIMQSSAQHCPNCLTWSPKSIMHFKEYLSTNTNRCFLRNLPRSLYPYGLPVKSLYPADQCFCYGYFPHCEITHLILQHNNNPCKTYLQCVGNPRDNLIIRGPTPLDGTPCENDDKVCWNGKCVQTNTT